MASQWMQRVRSRRIRQRRIEGDESLTQKEIKFWRRDAWRGETIEQHLERMYREASLERHHPQDWWRIRARIFEALGALNLTAKEWRMVDQVEKHGGSLHQVIKTVRITRRLKERLAN